MSDKKRASPSVDARGASRRELERKAPRSVWATQLPASRPIRWIVRESREANRTDFATHPARPRTDSPAFYRTNFARAPACQSDGLTFGIPSPAFPRTDSPALGRPTPIQPFPNPDMDGINRHSTTTQPTFVTNPRTISTQPSHIRILRIDNVELHGLGSSINCLGRRVTSYTTRDRKEIAKLLAMVS